jgi:hypothetical protein
MKRTTFLLLLLLIMVGCTSTNVGVKDVVLLPEDRIYTLKEGTSVNLMLDGKALDIVFPYDMKVVSPSILVRQEQDLNEAMLQKKKIEKDKAVRTGIMGSIIAALASALGLVLKAMKDKKKK